MSGLPEVEIDPSWWRDVVNAEGAGRMLSISHLIFEAAQDATEGPSAVVLHVLGIATSAILRADRWNEPFEPALVMDGRRSPLPSDLDPDKLALLSRIAHLMDDSDNASLRARVCDVSWFYGNRADVALLDRAIAAYTAAPLTRDAWHADGRHQWDRALELALRRGADGEVQVQTMGMALLERLRSVDGVGHFGIQLSQLIRSRRLTTKEEARELAGLCVDRGEEARQNANRHVGQGWEQEAISWFRSLNLHDQASAAQARLAESFASEADDRRRGIGGHAITASHFVELALKTLREIPRVYRLTHALDARMTELRAVLADDRQVLLESMVPLRGEPIDLAEQAADARRQVDGLDKVAALGALGMVSPLASFERMMSQAKVEIQEFPLSSLFGSETYSSSGQKVSSRSGADLAPATVAPCAAPDETLWSAMVRDHGILTSLVVQGRIVPALERIRLQHQYSGALLFDLCRRSPFVPSGREWTWARGLLHGLDGDFVSAVCVLVPQLEHLVRVQLKQAGVHTLITDERGVETEKGLSALLDDPKSADILGVDMRFELSALLTASHGPNLRNFVAHGLAPDGHLMGHAAVYAWWLAVRIAVPAWAAPKDVMDADADSPNGGDEDAEASDRQSDLRPTAPS